MGGLYRSHRNIVLKQPISFEVASEVKVDSSGGREDVVGVCNFGTKVS